MTGARTRRSRPMDAETRDHLADVRRRRRGIATPGERDRAAADQAVELWNKTYPPGIMVDVVEAAKRTKERVAALEAGLREAASALQDWMPSSDAARDVAIRLRALADG